MSIIAEEQSREGSAPIELYKFVGSITTYYHTSGAGDYEFISDTYTELTMDRESIPVDPMSEQEVLSVTFPVSSTIVQNYAFGNPPSTLFLWMYRVHPDTASSSVLWKGRLRGISVQGRDAVFTFNNLLGRSKDRKIPGPLIQVQCNHVLYDNKCTVLEASFTESTTIDAIDSAGTGVTVVSDGAQADGWAKGGTLVHIPTGEKRLIVDHTGLVMTLQWPFPVAVATDAVDILAGCDHSLSTCVSKFNNKSRFGGFPYVPENSVFINWKGLGG